MEPIKITMTDHWVKNAGNQGASEWIADQIIRGFESGKTDFTIEVHITSEEIVIED